jgi:hypothetical protein
MGGKTRLARRMVAVLDAHIFDLQTHFTADADLRARIDRYRPRDLEHLLLALNTPASLVAVDNIDFLLNTWTPRHKKEFVGMVERRLRAPGVTEKIFAFFIQTGPLIARHTLTNTKGQFRILPLDAFYAL